MATVASPSHALTHPAHGISAAPLSKSEARDLTQRINDTAGDLCLLLVEAHERQAWRALGYSSWTEYAEEELNISRSYAYRQLDLGRVTLALAAAVTGDEVSPTGDSPPVRLTEREARDIKPLLPEVTEEIKARVHAGEPAAEVVPDVVQEAREIRRATEEKPARKREPEPDEPDADNDAPDIADELERAHREIEMLQRQVDSLTEDDADRELRKLHAQVAQLNANHQGTLRTLAEVRRQAEYGEGQLRRIRKKLGVERDRDILVRLSDLLDD